MAPYPHPPVSLSTAIYRRQSASKPVRPQLGRWYLERYLAQEIVGPFCIGVAAGTTLLLGNQLFLYADLLVKKGISLSIVLQLLLLNLPAILVISFPIAALFSTLFVLGRLIADRELVALQAAGIARSRIVVPLLTVGLCASSLAFAISDGVVPYANRKVQALNQHLILTQDIPPVSEQQLLPVGEHLWLYITDTHRQTDSMSDLLVFDRQSEAGELVFPQIVLSNSAQWNGHSWTLDNAVVHRFNDDGSAKYSARSQSIHLNLRHELVEFVRGDRLPQAQSSRELWHTIQTEAEAGTPHEELVPLRNEWHLKFAIPLASLFATTIAVPLGLRTSRYTGRYGSIGLAIALVFAYYLLLSLARSYGNIGAVAPWLAAWLPNLIFGALGAALLWRYSR